MKKVRILNAAFWLALATILTVVACIGWSRNGCELQQLLIGGSFLMMFCGIFGYLADEKLRELNK